MDNDLSDENKKNVVVVHGTCCHKIGKRIYKRVNYTPTQKDA